MGQRASKEVAKRAAAAAAASADPLNGFARGAIRTSQEEAQGEFLRRAAGAGAGAAAPQSAAGQHEGSAQSKAAPEMPPELIKFMTDVGPLKRDDDGSGGNGSGVGLKLPRKTRLTDSSRKTENMRLAEQIEGYETARTSSFSSKRDKVDENDFGLDVIQMFALLSKNQQQSGGDDESTATAAASPQALLIIPPHHAAMVATALQAIRLPVLMEDRADKSYIGVAPDVAPELLALTPVAKTSVKLVLEDLWEREHINNKPTTPRPASAPT
jgi:hypothetical protein